MGEEIGVDIYLNAKDKVTKMDLGKKQYAYSILNVGKSCN